MTANQFRAALDRLSYNPETGEFHWKVATRNALPGKRAGFLTSSGQIAIKIDGSHCMAHQVAWFMVYGRLPTGVIDHINGVKTDNRIANLREATASQNQWNRGAPRNNTSGAKGVSWRARRKKWYASISANGRQFYLGSFDTKEQAAEAYAAACRTHHGTYGRSL